MHLPQDHYDVACPLIELDRVLQQHPPHHAAARVHTNGVAQQRAGGTGVRAPPTLRTARLPQAGKHEVSLSLSPLSLALSLVAHSQHTHMHMHRAWAWACGTGMCTAHGMAHSACVRASGVTVHCTAPGVAAGMCMCMCARAWSSCSRKARATGDGRCHRHRCCQRVPAARALSEPSPPSAASLRPGPTDGCSAPGSGKGAGGSVNRGGG